MTAEMTACVAAALLARVGYRAIVNALERIEEAVSTREEGDTGSRKGRMKGGFECRGIS